MHALLTMLNSMSRSDRRWLVSQLSEQVEREEEEAEKSWQEFLSSRTTWEEEDNANLDAFLANVSGEWGGDKGLPVVSCYNSGTVCCALIALLLSGLRFFFLSYFVKLGISPKACEVLEFCLHGDYSLFNIKASLNDCQGHVNRTSTAPTMPNGEKWWRSSVVYNWHNTISPLHFDKRGGNCL